MAGGNTDVVQHLEAGLYSPAGSPWRWAGWQLRPEGQDVVPLQGP